MGPRSYIEVYFKKIGVTSHIKCYLMRWKTEYCSQDLATWKLSVTMLDRGSGESLIWVDSKEKGL